MATNKRQPIPNCLECGSPISRDVHAGTKYCSKDCLDEVRRRRCRNRERAIRAGTYKRTKGYRSIKDIAVEDQICPAGKALARTAWNKSFIERLEGMSHDIRSA